MSIEVKHCVVVLDDGNFAVRREDIETRRQFLIGKKVTTSTYYFCGATGNVTWHNALGMYGYSFHKISNQKEAESRLDYVVKAYIGGCDVGIEFKCV